MRRLTIGATALLLAPAFHGGASAQPRTGISMVGIWSGETPGQGGMVRGSDQYLPGGSYVSAMQLPNGSIQRIWGSYRAQQTSPRQIHLSLQTQGFLPCQICAQAPGFPVRCRQNQVPSSAEMDVNFVSPSIVQVNGITMRRRGASPLLIARVPEQLILAAAAPIIPNMRQPVMPNNPSHYTPTGPGSVQAMRQGDQMQQYRICAANGGQVVQERGGTVRCVS